MAYHGFKVQDEGERQRDRRGRFQPVETHGSFETFEVKASRTAVEVEGNEPLEPGWYWWACFPGCLPDGEPEGPFETEREAVASAQAS